ncbi:MAG: GGDEF domain-containing protein [Planctomycetaceae bacterium]
MRMLQESWEETIANSTVRRTAESDGGCLLQIHPLNVSAELVRLELNQTTVGREMSCGLSLPDSSVSRQHAVIERTDSGYRITDLGSTNGTCINERRITTAELHPGDRIQFGSFIFKFLSTNHIELQYHEAVYSMMTRDGLTGTLNKRSFMEILDREFHRSVHRGTDLSLIMFDVDHFKSVNDTWGHLAGDEVLQELGRRIGRIVEDHDVFARYGGEEFAVLLAGVSQDEARRLAETIRQTVAVEPFATGAGPLELTVSLGVADTREMSPESVSADLIQRADQRLYLAKGSGRNRVCS